MCDHCNHHQLLLRARSLRNCTITLARPELIRRADYQSWAAPTRDWLGVMIKWVERHRHCTSAQWGALLRGEVALERWRTGGLALKQDSDGNWSEDEDYAIKHRDVARRARAAMRSIQYREGTGEGDAAFERPSV